MAKKLQPKYIANLVKKIDWAAREHEIQGCGDPADWRKDDLYYNRLWRRLYLHLGLPVEQAPQVKVSPKYEGSGED